MLKNSTYICHANKERRLVVKPVHLNFNYWKRTIENERRAAQASLLFFYTMFQINWYFHQKIPFHYILKQFYVSLVPKSYTYITL